MAAILHELINFSPDQVQIMNIKIKDIQVNPLNNIYEITEIDQLAQSIAENGLLSPLTVIKRNGEYKLIGGERRLTAIKQLGWTDVNCFILDKDDMTEDDEQLLLVTSNITRNMSVADKVKITSKVEEIYNRKKELGEIRGLKKRDYIARITGYGVRSVQDYLTKIHGKNEPTKLDISIDEQIPGQLSMEEIYPEAANREVIKDDYNTGTEEHEDLHHELKQIMYGYYPRVSHKEAARIIADIEILLRKRGLV